MLILLYNYIICFIYKKEANIRVHKARLIFRQKASFSLSQIYICVHTIMHSITDWEMVMFCCCCCCCCCYWCGDAVPLCFFFTPSSSSSNQSKIILSVLFSPFSWPQSIIWMYRHGFVIHSIEAAAIAAAAAAASPIHKPFIMSNPDRHAITTTNKLLQCFFWNMVLSCCNDDDDDAAEGGGGGGGRGSSSDVVF